MAARIARLQLRLTTDFDNGRFEAELTRTDHEFREARKRLKHAIHQSKKRCHGRRRPIRETLQTGIEEAKETSSDNLYGDPYTANSYRYAVPS